MTDGNFRLYVPCTLRDIPSDSAAFLWGRAAEDGASFEATRIVTDRPPVPFQHGRVISREASGLLGQEDGKLTLLYDRQKPACPVTLAPNCELFVSHRTDVTAVRNNMLVDLHGHTLYAGGPVSLTWLIMYVSSEQELPSPKRQSRGLTWRWTA